MADEGWDIPPLTEDEEYVVAKSQMPGDRVLHRRTKGEEGAFCKSRGRVDSQSVYVPVEDIVASYTPACRKCWPDE